MQQSGGIGGNLSPLEPAYAMVKNGSGEARRAGEIIGLSTPYYSGFSSTAETFRDRPVLNGVEADQTEHLLSFAVYVEDCAEDVTAPAVVSGVTEAYIISGQTTWDEQAHYFARPGATGESLTTWFWGGARLMHKITTDSTLQLAYVCLGNNAFWDYLCKPWNYPWSKNTQESAHLYMGTFGAEYPTGIEIPGVINRWWDISSNLWLRVGYSLFEKSPIVTIAEGRPADEPPP